MPRLTPAALATTRLVGRTLRSGGLARLTHRALPVLLGLMLVGVTTPVLADDPPPEIDLERARALDAQARTLRDQAESEFRTAEPSCYERFQVNRCLEQARQRRLDLIREARALEIEARKIELADRQRQVEEQGLTEQTPQPDRGIPQPTPIPQTGTDARVLDIRTQREAAAAAAEAQATRERREADAQREESRARAERAAARRAEQAARDRERYDERIRKREDTTGTIR